MWWIYALLSALFASLTAIFAKQGVEYMNSNLATAIRTAIILIMLSMIVLLRGETKGDRKFIEAKSSFSKRYQH